jgi:predicted transcriptional regulator
MIVIPKCSYNLNNSENQLLLELSKSPSLSLTEISEKTSLSKAIIYRNLRELKTKSLIVDFEKGFALTDFGKIAIL